MLERQVFSNGDWGCVLPFSFRFLLASVWRFNPPEILLNSPAEPPNLALSDFYRRNWVSLSGSLTEYWHSPQPGPFSSQWSLSTEHSRWSWTWCRRWVSLSNFKLNISFKILIRTGLAPDIILLRDAPGPLTRVWVVFTRGRRSNSVLPFSGFVLFSSPTLSCFANEEEKTLIIWKRYFIRTRSNNSLIWSYHDLGALLIIPFVLVQTGGLAQYNPQQIVKQC